MGCEITKTEKAKREMFLSSAHKLLFFSISEYLRKKKKTFSETLTKV